VQKKFVLFIIFSLALGVSYTQDTVAVFFEFGKSQLTQKTKNTAKKLPVKYDLSRVDSIVFIGLADSVGSLRSNLRLSKKRADKVEQFCSHLIPEDIKTMTYAKGEGYKTVRALNRRVDILIYYQPKMVKKPRIKQKPKEQCYLVDYDLLSLTHWRIIEKRRKKYVLIEVPIHKNPIGKDLHYGVKSYDGTFTTRKVRWEKRTMGHLWWSNKRYVTTIPKASFEKYRLFRIDDPPCNDCHEPFDSIPEIKKWRVCQQTDYFLMKNLQFTFNFLNKRRVKVRVPREYVNPELNYYYDYKKEINWETKSGSKNANYLFTELPHDEGLIENITKDAMCPLQHYGDCIPRDTSLSGYSWDMPCYMNMRGYMGLFIIGELGSYYQNDSLIPYASLGIEKRGLRSRLSLLAGTDIDWGFYGAFRYQYNFFEQPLRVFNPFNSWIKPGGGGRMYGQFYLGTELKTRINGDEDPLLEQNIHLGFAAVNNTSNPILSRGFFQFGYGHDYLRNQEKNFYPVLQVGIVFDLLAL